MPSLLDRALSSVGLSRIAPPRTKRSAFLGAASNRTTADWIFAPILSANKEIQGDLMTLRARSREQARNNPIVKRFLSQAEESVVGPDGIKFQAQVKSKAGALDDAVNTELERAWKAFSKADVASADGRLTLHGIARQAIRLKKMDGECLIRIIRGAANPFALTLQVLDPDQLDEGYNSLTGTGNRITMGVEVNAFGRAVAYHLWSAHPNDMSGQERRRERISADDLIHLYTVDRPGQVRGVPETAAVLAMLKMLSGYIEAELIAARTAAAKMGFFTSKEDSVAVNADEAGSSAPLTMDAEPGMMHELEAGKEFQPWDPQHPVAAFGDFVKAVGRLIAAGFRVSYATLFNDLEAVNFSSGKLGLQSERDMWRLEQDDMISRFYERVYGEFVKMGLAAGAIKLPAARAPEYAAVSWMPRSWASPDPMKDAESDAMEISMGFATFSDKAALRGMDWTENVTRLAKEYETIKSLKVPISLAAPMATGAQPDGSTTADTQPTRPARVA